ncbi:hypothetical protein [Halomonas sp.]|uniref:hypothetical protein n=1 Tax=Halomonas sp. TaxID=1486246 RepID=UPI00257BCBBD|nr:hypothetical protein [Halomonas sp.]
MTALTYDIEDMLSLQKRLGKRKTHRVKYHKQGIQGDAQGASKPGRRAVSLEDDLDGILVVTSFEELG